MTETMRPAPRQDRWKSSVLLRGAARARYEARGRSLAALVEKGLDAFDAEDAAEKLSLAAESAAALDPVKAIVIEFERMLRASLNEHGMIAWPGLPEGHVPELAQPRTGPVKMRPGRRPKLRYVPREEKQA